MIINMFFWYELFEYILGLIVQSVQLMFYSSVFEYFEDVSIDVFDRVFSVVLHWLGKDVISSEITIVAADGWYNKLTYLISTYFASDGFIMNVSMMSTMTWCLFVW